MLKLLLPVLALTPAAAAAQAVQPGRWDVTSKVTDINVPGVPGFMLRMIRGKTRAEHKRLVGGEGIDALLAPDPKARCRIDSQYIADGRYSQVLSCPGKNGAPLRIARTGSYTAAGFVGRASVSGTTPKGPMTVALEQQATRVGGG
jgi:hypothetical protein